MDEELFDGLGKEANWLIQSMVSAHQIPNVQPLADESLYRFALGWSTKLEGEQVVERVVRDPVLRQKLVHLKEHVGSILQHSGSLDQVANFNAIFADVFQEALMESMNVYASWNDSLQELVRGGRRKKFVERSLLAAWYGSTFQTPSLNFATHRGATSKVLVEVNDSFGQADLEITEHGESIELAISSEAIPAESKCLTLFVSKQNSGWLEVASANSGCQNWRLDSSEVKKMVDLLPDLFTAGQFKLSDNVPQQVSTVYLTQSSDDEQSPEIATPLRLVTEPQICDGKFTMDFVFPLMLRAKCLTRNLQVCIGIGTSYMVLAEFLISELSKDPLVSVQVQTSYLDCRFKYGRAIFLRIE